VLEKNNFKEAWQEHYASCIGKRDIYPTEWIIRTLAAPNYPGMQLDKADYKEAKILDLSCGDGRNLALLQNLGFSVYASEVSDDIVTLLESQKERMGWTVDFFAGTNTALPVGNAFFDYLLSCWSFYYLQGETVVPEVLKEIARVLKPGGYFIAGIPDAKNSVLQGATLLDDGSMMIRNDPNKLRNGERFMVANNADEVRALLAPYFDNIKVGYLYDDYFGLVVSGFVFVCQKV
jgi:SAM-dependent methyltransferase